MPKNSLWSLVDYWRIAYEDILVMTLHGYVENTRGGRSQAAIAPQSPPDATRLACLGGGGRRDRERIALVWAVTLGLAGSRWGAHLGYPPLFLTDLLVALGVVHALMGILQFGPRPKSGVAERAHPGVLVGLLLAWAALRLVTSPEWSLTALRDAVPYLYAIVAFVAASSYARSNQANRNNAARFVTAALLFHLGWCALAVIAPRYIGRLPLVPDAPVRFLSVRGDVDSAFVGLLMALGLARVLAGRNAGRWMLILVLSAATLTRLNSRAGLVACVVACTFVLVAALTSTHLISSRRTVILALAPVVAAAVIVALPQTLPGQRLIGTIASNPESAAQANAAGTTRARTTAWRRTIDYTNETGYRQLVGVGFGPDFLAAAGARDIISGGRDGVRSPHNWLLGTYARLGLVGLVLATCLAFSVLRAAWRARRDVMHDDLLLVVCVVAIGLIVIGALGVVLESPFGAVPFFWCAGILLTRRGSRPALENARRLGGQE